MLRIAIFSKGTEINSRKSRKSQKVTLQGLTSLFDNFLTLSSPTVILKFFNVWDRWDRRTDYYWNKRKMAISETFQTTKMELSAIKSWSSFIGLKPCASAFITAYCQHKLFLVDIGGFTLYCSGVFLFVGWLLFFLRWVLLWNYSGKYVDSVKFHFLKKKKMKFQQSQKLKVTNLVKLNTFLIL